MPAAADYRLLLLFADGCWGLSAAAADCGGCQQLLLTAAAAGGYCYLLAVAADCGGCRPLLLLVGA